MIKQKIEKVENLEVVNAGALKRVGALLVDVIFMGLLLVLLSLVVRPILNATSDLTNKYEEVQREIKRSHLVSLSAEISDDESNIDIVKIEADSLPYYQQAEATYHFYLDYLSARIDDDGEVIDDEWYFKNILLINEEKTLFKRIENTNPNPKIKYSSADSSSGEATSETNPLFDPFLPDGITYKDSEPNAVALNEFYLKIYQTAISVLKANETYQEVNNLVLMENILLIVLSSSVVFLAFPLFLKNGQTFGKMIFKLGVVTTYGYKIKPMQLLLRYFIFLVVNLLSNLFIPFIFPFISLTVMVFTKRNKSIHDFIANTRVIDLKKSKIYNDVEEYTNSLRVVSTVREGNFNEEVFHDRFKEDSGA